MTQTLSFQDSQRLPVHTVRPLLPAKDAEFHPYKVRIHLSIRDIGEEKWNACFAGALEDYHYLLTVEDAGIAGFTWRYVTVESGETMLAAMPAFLVDYPLDTTLDDGWLRRAIRNVRRVFPRFLVLKLACLGSLETEHAPLGFHPSVAPARRPELLAQLFAGFEKHAGLNGIKLIGVKDIPAPHKALWDEADTGLCVMPGMASARLDINFKTMDAYFAALSSQTRKDMRRKLKTRPAIRIEQRTHIDDVLADIMQLYLVTKNRSEFQFGELTPAYFRGLLSHLRGRAYCTLYYADDQLLAANFLLKDDHTLLDKFFCMNEAGRAHNLYFLSWFYNLECCLQYGISQYQIGQAGYENKLRLKGMLTANWMMFKHASPVINLLLKMMAPLFAIEEAA